MVGHANFQNDQMILGSSEHKNINKRWIKTFATRKKLYESHAKFCRYHLK